MLQGTGGGEGTVVSEQKVGEAERLTKLALFVKAHEPVDFIRIRSGLNEYAHYAGTDKAEKKRHDQKVRRMFERDKKTLEEYGIYIEPDGYNRYVINRDASYAAPVEIDEAQASLLRAICSALLSDESYPFRSELRMILAKIGDEFDAPDMLSGIGKDASAGDVRATGFGKVKKAINQRKRIKFSYVNASGRTSEREVEPFGCFFIKRTCYVVAHDPQVGGDGVRTFRLDRMSQLNLATGAKGPEFEERSFELDEWFGLPFQFGDEEFEAVIRFSANAAWRAQHVCMGKGRLEEQGNEVLWHVSARDTENLVKWCVEAGPGVSIVQPVRARIVYEEGLKRFLEAVA